MNINNIDIVTDALRAVKNMLIENNPEVYQEHINKRLVTVEKYTNKIIKENEKCLKHSI